MVYVVAATFKFKPESMTEVLKLLTTFRDWVKVNHSDTCLKFNVGVDISDPTIVYRYEEWTNAEANAVITTSPEHDIVKQRMPALIASPPEKRVFENVV